MADANTIEDRYPAPWEYDAELNRVYSVPSNLCVATPHIPTNQVCVADFPPLARMIAAAPDLLQQAKREVDWLRHIRPRIAGRVPGSILTEFDQAIKALSAVIAKTEGHSM
ncbi:MAG: hypothetical protein HC900_00115 [Methylacidiphilales bacterium]|nr:hypothetical protein [Candidatus Methylacidiphilales bacterium]